MDLTKIAEYADCDDLHMELLDLTKYDNTKPTILIVDDYKSVITLFKRLVGRMKLEEHFNIIYSNGNDAGLRVLKTVYCKYDTGLQIDLLLTDITFGGNLKVKGTLRNINGVELVGILQSVYPAIRYEFITGHTVEIDTRPELFEDFQLYNTVDDLRDYVTYKDKPISTDVNLILKLLKGTEYENLF